MFRSTVSWIRSVLYFSFSDKHMPFPDNFKEFTRTLLATRQSPPSASATFNPLFDVDQIKSITDYFGNRLIFLSHWYVIVIYNILPNVP